MSNTNVGEQRSTSRLARVTEEIRNRPKVRIGLVVGIPVTFLGVFFVFPLFSMFQMSFLTSLPPSGQFTLSNYSQVTDPVYLDILQRTAVLTIQTTVIVVLAGYSMAYSAVRFSKRASLVLLLVILPFWTNYIIRMYAWINILQNGGVLDSVLMMIGALQEPQGFLYTTEAVLVGFSYVWLPMATLPFYATLSNLDEDLIEAAKDLGSGPIKTFLTVTLPLSKNGIIAGVILTAIPTFGSFITPALLGGTNVTMIGMVIESQFKEAFNWPFGSALGVVVSILVVGALLIGVRSTNGGLIGGGEA